MRKERSCILLLAGLSGLAAAAEETTSETAVPDSVKFRQLDEIVVEAHSARGRIQSLPGSERLELDQLSQTPQLLGEKDIIKAVTLLPGVKSESQGIGGFEVRGGNATQNLVTMDGMTLYNPAHLMGIFSTFNDDAMGGAVLHKGPIPSRIGGASSAALETTMRSGDRKDYHALGSIGLLNARLAANGPIVKDKLTFNVAARSSYIGLFLKLVPEYSKTKLDFYDINAKLRYCINNSNTLEGSFFFARDNMAISDLMSMNWGNLAGSINWRASAGDRWRFCTTAAVTDYSSTMGMDMMDMDMKVREYIRNFSINENAEYLIADGHRLEFGLRSELLRVKSGDIRLNLAHLYEVKSGWQNALWVGYEGNAASWLSLTAGARLSLFSALSGDAFHEFHAIDEEAPDFSSKTYVDIEPRLAMAFHVNDNHSIKAGASLTTQNLHGVRSSTSTFPFDRYVLSSAAVKPERVLLASLGYSGMTANGDWDWSAEGYYKSMRNVYDYRDGMTMMSRINMESLILGGKGRSYGMELMLRKNHGHLTGWISYTLSWTDNKIAGINDGRWYRASNDRRHDVAVVGIYTFNDKWSLSGSWTYSSGRPITAPDVKYQMDGCTYYYYSQRNGYKTPASHRLDLSATYRKQSGLLTHEVTFGVFNAYAHYSPFVIYFEDDKTKPSGTRAVQQSLFGIIPSISYTLKFQ